MKDGGGLEGFTIYENPRDYPGEFVCRRWIAEAGLVRQCELVARGSTLREVRRALPKGLYNLGRQFADEPQIVEVWV